MSQIQALPATHRALVLTSTDQPLEVKVIATPQPGPGSTVVRVEAAGILSYSKNIYNGVRSYPFPTPLVIGCSGIGRIAASGPDATDLKVGDLVFLDCFVQSRDNPSDIFLLGIHEGHTEGSKLLMSGEWRNATYAEYAKMPLENCYKLNENTMQKLGYGVDELQDISRLLVPYGGLRSINLTAGETIAIAPATGSFGSAAVKVALAMGARVIALGRNKEALNLLAKSHPRVEIVTITGDVKADSAAITSFGQVNAFLDISPAEAADSTHFTSSILALAQGGRACFMGGFAGKELKVPVRYMVTRDLVLKGKWMYSRQDVRDLIKMVEVGVLDLTRDGEPVQKFGLDEWEEGFEAAGVKGATCVIVP